MLYSQSAINDLLYYDVVCIGNYAAIVADQINCKRLYKIAVLHFNKQVSIPLITSSGQEIIPVNYRPKETDMIRKKIQQILPN